MSIHVLQLGPYPPPEGGVTRNMLAIRGRLRERGDRCSIVATSRSSRFQNEVDVHHPRSAMDLIASIRNLDHDILHLHIGGNIDRRILALCVTAATFGNNPILSVHSGGYAMTPEALAAKRGSLRGGIFRRFSRVIVVNEELEKVFHRYGATVEMIPPFALSPPDPETAVTPELRDFALSHSPFLVSVGGLEADYDPLFQIRSMRSVLSKFPNAGLMMIGGGSMKERVRSEAAESGYAANICLAGDVPHSETLHLISMADVMLRITLFDGDAISVRESLFVGTPVIATDNGMRPEGVRLIKIGEPDRLVHEIGRALESSGKGSVSAVPDNSNIDRVLELYDSLL